jgi:hypothetical protein
MEWFAEKVEPSATCPTKPNASTFTLCDVWPKTYLPIPKFGMEATPQTFFGGRNVALTTTIRSTVSAIHVKMLCGSHPTFVLIDPK